MSVYFLWLISQFLKFKIFLVARASFYFYNTREDVDKLVEGLEKIYEMFKKWM